MNSRDFCYWLQGYFEIHAEGMGERSGEKLVGVTLYPLMAHYSMA